MGGVESDGEVQDVPTTAEGVEEHTAFRTRSRRVSFAETTAIHFFKRDEDYETPPGSSTPGSRIAAGKPLVFCADHAEGDNDDSYGNGTEEGEEEEHELFVKNVMDSSPGSCFGSATSNDDYNLFGPVSTSFIRSDQAEALSETSEDNNHDITLDSMTFSMHFRNVLPRDDLSIDSAGSLNTPTGVSTPTDTGNFASFTGVRKNLSATISGGDVNNDSGMSFVTQKSKEYDYEKLPSRLETLLVNVDESMDMPSPRSGIKVTSKECDYEKLSPGLGTLPANVNESMEMPSSRSDVKVTSSSVNIDSLESGCKVELLDVHNGSPNIGVNIEAPCTSIVSPRSDNKISSFSNTDVFARNVNVDASSSMNKVASRSENEITSLGMDMMLPKSVNVMESSVSTMNDCLVQHEETNDEKPPTITNDIEAVNMVDDIYEETRISSHKVSGNGFVPNTLSNCQTKPGTSTCAESPTTRKTNVSAMENAQIPIERTSLANDKSAPIHPRDSVPSSTRDPYHLHESHESAEVSCDLIPCLDVEIIGKRQSNEETTLTNETKRAQKHRKITPHNNFGASISLTIPSISKESSYTGSEASTKSWKEIFSRVAEIAEKPFPMLVDVTGSEEINIVEDHLADLQRARKFHWLYIVMQSMMKQNQHCRGPQRRSGRVAEVKLLQDMIVYEKAKLQLAKEKRDGFLKKIQKLQSGIVECHRLRCAFTKNYHSYVGKNKLMNSLQHSPTYSSEEQDKLSSTRQELEDLEERLKRFSDLFETPCKSSKTLSFDEMTKILNDQLNWKNHCRNILNDFLPWKIVDVQNEEDQYHMLLSYQNLLYQRFTFKAVPGSGLYFRNSVNAANIEKRFPNMRACAAFDFLFKIRDDCRLNELKCLQHETQTTSFVFGNLLDLLGEVQTAELKIENLISSSFFSPQSRQLQLELGFLNFKSGRKVILSLDMSFLESGLYPFEPSGIQMTITGGKNELPSSVSDEIVRAIRGLEAGHSPITSICRLISHAL